MSIHARYWIRHNKKALSNLLDIEQMKVKTIVDDAAKRNAVARTRDFLRHI
jgi:hypothetical protein